MIQSFADHQVFTPASLDQALTFLSENTSLRWQPLAGCTDAILPLYLGMQQPHRHWLDLSKLSPELRFIRVQANEIKIGALTTIADLLKNEPYFQFCPLIAEAAGWVAGVAVRNRATVVGNIVNGSPAADLPPVWLCLGAEIEIASAQGVRRLSLERFWTGYKTNLLKSDELVISLILDLNRVQFNRAYFRKVSPRLADSIGHVIFAGMGERDDSGRWNKIQLAYGCMGPFPRRAYQAESEVQGQVFDHRSWPQIEFLLKQELKPVDDDRTTAEYRMQVALNLTREFLQGNLQLQSKGTSR